MPRGSDKRAPFPGNIGVNQNKGLSQSIRIRNLRTLPTQLGRAFDSQREAIVWARRLVVSGYPAKRHGRNVWTSTENLQPAAVKMAMQFGFEEVEN